MNNNMQVEKFLPIGSVVLLKEAKKKLMITGFCISTPEVPNKIFDYSGCFYPEGLLDLNKIALFDHDQIERIFAFGYSDEEEKEFKIKLNEELTKRGINE